MESDRDLIVMAALERRKVRKSAGKQSMDRSTNSNNLRTNTIAALENGKGNYFHQTLLMSISVGLLTVSLSLAKTGRDALFFHDQGLLQLPMAYMGIGMSSLPAAFLFVRAMKLWGARSARVGIMILASVVLAGFVPFLNHANHAVLMSNFVFVPTILGLLFASTWLLVSDLFEHAPETVAARSFSRIGASSLAGGMVGGFVSKALAPQLDPEWLLLLAALVVLVVVGLILKAHREFRPPVPTIATKPNTKVKSLSVFSNRYFRILALLSMFGGLAGLLIEFQFYAAASSLGNDLRGNTNFFANFYTLVYLSSLVIEIFLTPKIQAKFGVSGGLVILPVALLGGSAFALAAATSLSRSVLKVTEGSLKASIHRPLWEQAFIPLKSSERSIGKILVDGIAPRIAEGIGAMMLVLWAMRFDSADKNIDLSNVFHDTRWTIWVILISVVVWLFLIQKLYREMGHLGFLQGSETDCVRFPDQCPTTTELGKWIA